MPDPGWYNDEHDPSRARWHDGSRWTQHTIVKAEWPPSRGKPPPPLQPSAEADAQSFNPGPLFPPTRSPAPHRARARGWWIPAAAFGALAVGVLGWLFIRSDGGGGSPTSGPTYASPKAIADALTAAGLTCTDFEAVDLTNDEETMSFGPELRTAAGTCQVDGSELSIDMFADAAHQKQQTEMGEALGCSFLESFGIDVVNYAEGNLWQISLEDNLDEALTRRIADSLGGRARQLRC